MFDPFEWALTETQESQSRNIKLLLTPAEFKVMIANMAHKYFD